MRRMATRFIAWIVASKSAGATPRTRSMSIECGSLAFCFGILAVS